jgi:cytochrome c-type biogenesis protein CcmE
MKTYAKFAAVVVVVIGVLAWLAVGGVSESKSYYKTIAELDKMGDQARGKRLRVSGYVVPGSIVRSGRDVRFVIHEEALKLNVVYVGSEPLPDTFKDESQALADGHYGVDGVFQANKIQAKCASKYEAKPRAAANQPGV